MGQHRHIIDRKHANTHTIDRRQSPHEVRVAPGKHQQQALYRSSIASSIGSRSGGIDNHTTAASQTMTSPSRLQNHRLQWPQHGSRHQSCGKGTSGARGDVPWAREGGKQALLGGRRARTTTRQTVHSATTNSPETDLQTQEMHHLQSKTNKGSDRRAKMWSSHTLEEYCTVDV